MGSREFVRVAVVTTANVPGPAFTLALAGAVVVGMCAGSELAVEPPPAVAAAAYAVGAVAAVIAASGVVRGVAAEAASSLSAPSVLGERFPVGSFTIYDFGLSGFWIGLN